MKSGFLDRKNPTNCTGMWITLSFLAAAPLPPTATPFTCIMARRIRALPWPLAVFAPFLNGLNNTDKEPEPFLVANDEEAGASAANAAE
jgi:hypothetical protein